MEQFPAASTRSDCVCLGKNGKMGVSGRICLYVACYDFVLGFNVSSSPLMIFQVGFGGNFVAKVMCQCLD